MGIDLQHIDESEPMTVVHRLLRHDGTVDDFPHQALSIQGDGGEGREAGHHTVEFNIIRGKGAEVNGVGSDFREFRQSDDLGT